MKTTFISHDLWPALTKAVRASPTRCDIAVAYFAKGAEKLLPIANGSRLVVDASEGAVTSGQTYPPSLKKLVERGVQVFSVPNLHAKVFVLGKVAFIGSSNASNRSAGHLIEAALRTTDDAAVKAARTFVRDSCLHELTPELLKKLAKMYRPPRVPGGKQRKRQTADTSKRPTLPRLFIQQLVRVDLSDREQKLHDREMKVAEKRRQHPRSFELDSFLLHKKNPYRLGDVVVQVVDEGGGRMLVSPPGNVVHTRTRANGSRSVSFVYVERPIRRRRDVRTLARALGVGAFSKLTTDGLVEDAEFARALLNKWAG